MSSTQALCLSPTYELAVQTGEVVAKMASYCPDITIKYALRGEESKFLVIYFINHSLIRLYIL